MLKSDGGPFEAGQREKSRHLVDNHIKSLEKRLSEPSSAIGHQIAIMRIRSLSHSEEFLDSVLERLSDPSLNTKERSRLIRRIATNKHLSKGKREAILSRIPRMDDEKVASLKRRISNRDSSPKKRRRIQRQIYRGQASSNAESRIGTALPHPATLAFMKGLVKETRLGFENLTSMEFVTDHTPKSLVSLDEFMKNLKWAGWGPQPRNDWEENILQLFLLGAGSYFGEVVVRNIGGKWCYPGLLRRYWGSKTASFGFSYGQVSVKVNGRKTRLLELARSVFDNDPAASFWQAFQSLSGFRSN
jgi:hypothetical protein